MNRTLILAEPGCTAQGDFDTYLRLIETAAECGASCWKPQWVSDPAQMCERRHIGVDHPKRAYYLKAYGWLAFPLDWHTHFRHRCTQFGLQYACSVFVPQDVAVIAPLVDYLKISSFEACDGALVAAAMWHHPRVILSSGMQSADDGLECAYVPVGDDGYEERAVWAHLHCVSSYPAPLQAMNLSVLRAWREGQRGLSDHSRNVLTGAVAVGAGATILETHYCLDDCDPENPDYPVAFTPGEFAEYIRNVRTAEAMMGDGVKRVQECEKWALPYRVTG